MNEFAMTFWMSVGVFCANAQLVTVVSSRSKLLRKAMAIAIVLRRDVAGEFISGSASNFARSFFNRLRSREANSSVTRYKKSALTQNLIQNKLTGWQGLLAVNTDGKQHYSTQGCLK